MAALFAGVLPRGALLWMRSHEPHHFEMLLSLESIDEGLERFIFVLVHLEEPVPSLLEVVASHCKVTWIPLDFGVDALDCGSHHTPEARGSGAALAFEVREDILPEPDNWHVPDLFCCLKVNLFVFAIYNAGHLRRHEELPQLC